MSLKVIAMSSPKSGEHHDVHDIEKVIGDMFNDLEKSHIRVDGLFLNADAGFDCDALRGFLCEKEIIANICINKRREVQKRLGTGETQKSSH